MKKKMAILKSSEILQIIPATYPEAYVSFTKDENARLGDENTPKVVAWAVVKDRDVNMQTIEPLIAFNHSLGLARMRNQDYTLIVK